jgi:hypothetical protein
VTRVEVGSVEGSKENIRGVGVKKGQMMVAEKGEVGRREEGSCGGGLLEMMM